MDEHKWTFEQVVAALPQAAEEQSIEFDDVLELAEWSQDEYYEEVEYRRFKQAQVESSKQGGQEMSRHAIFVAGTKSDQEAGIASIEFEVETYFPAHTIVHELGEYEAVVTVTVPAAGASLMAEFTASFNADFAVAGHNGMPDCDDGFGVSDAQGESHNGEERARIESHFKARVDDLAEATQVHITDAGMDDSEGWQVQVRMWVDEAFFDLLNAYQSKERLIAGL